ncbi:hypothetical protein AMECASPLE_036762 [Ameca splendens]|uniref:Uncharacterized protein n=1 Tax=Ameca splendens TaxID=208324 RepID=A0ABV0XKR5_9TELE
MIIKKETLIVSTTPQTPNVAGRHPVDVEVSRLFASRSSTRHPRRSNATVSLLTYTHIFCCLGRKDSTFVPRRPDKDVFIGQDWVSGAYVSKVTFKAVRN